MADWFTDADVEALAGHFRNVRDASIYNGGPDDDYCAEACRDLLASLAPRIAQAWDEGYRDGRDDEGMRGSRPNPYRGTEAGESRG